MTATALASKIGLTVAPCHRRLRELESTGVIRGYRAELDARALGLGFEAIVFVTLGVTDVETISAFEAAALEVPNIVDAQRLFGEPDYILRLLTRDLAAYQELYDSVLGSLPGVQRLTSTLVMKRLVSDRTVPIP